MKVLFIDHVEPDYLAAIVYLGLCQELGPNNVVDWPYKITYHGGSYVGPIPYPPPGDWGVASPFPWMPAMSSRIWTASEVINSAREFDVVVLASPRAYSIDALQGLLGAVGRGAIRRLVLLDGEDYTAVRWDLVERFRPNVYFKLSMVKDPYEVYIGEKARVVGTTRLLPIPLASPLGELLPLSKETDVVFFGGGSWRPVRQEGVPAGPSPRAALEQRLRREFQSFKGGVLEYNEYVSELCKAKIAVCVGGSGLEPLRTFEILSCPSTLLMRERIAVISPCPFVEGSDHVGFDGTDPDDLIRNIKYYLDNELERQRIATVGNLYLRTHHTPRARGQYLLAEALR
jgi:hypothetical protein